MINFENLSGELGISRVFLSIIIPFISVKIILAYIFNLWNPPAFLAGYPNDGNGHVDLVDGKYVYTDNFTDANAKRWFKLANGYFQRGLIDPASFTAPKSSFGGYGSAGEVVD